MTAILNIKKIINAGEMPNNCLECDLCKNEYFFAESQRKFICLAMNRALNKKDKTEQRPSWCPLATYNECFDWMFFKQPATQHIEDVINGKFGPESLEI